MYEYDILVYLVYYLKTKETRMVHKISTYGQNHIFIKFTFNRKYIKNFKYCTIYLKSIKLDQFSSLKLLALLTNRKRRNFKKFHSTYVITV